MPKHRFSRSIIAATLLVGLSMGPAMADCPSLPDGPDSNNVTNAQQRALCLQLQLQDSTAQRSAQTQFDNLQNSMDQLQIERRLDTIPPIAPLPPWQSRTSPWQF